MNDYIKIKEKYIEDVFGIVSLYEHKKTKAHVVVIKNDDNNKVFNISFKTIPHDDSGVAHILEHSVLCGSKKYNVKDPFVELLKSSLNTFLNAITYSDKTCYPCASLNESDFKNLISVYLDAVFYPNIYKNEEIFLQEGIRIDENFNFNGVVFNEMKGAYSSPEQILMYNIMKNIFPNTIYKYESGGYPLNICDLTYKDFLEYHKKYYHPSNSYIYLYGNMDEEEILNYISNNYLNNFKYQEYVEEIEYEKAFLKPKKIMNTYYLSGNDLNNKTFLSYNIALNNNKDIKGLIALNLILNYLFSSNGPLLKKIVDEEICYDVAITFTDNIKQPLINIIGINGDLKNEDLFINIIDNEFKRYFKEGLDHKAILNLITYAEFKALEKPLGYNPRGLNVILNSLATMLYDNYDPFSQIDVIKYYKILKEDLDKGYFEEVLSKYIINNNHKLYASLVPTNKINLELDDKLNIIKNKLTNEDIKLIKKKNELLKIYQNKEDNKLDLLNIPKLELKDIEINKEKFNLDIINKEYKTLYSNYQTNTICYTNMYFDISNLNELDLKYMSLLSQILLNVPTKRHDIYNLEQIKLELTGMLNFTNSITCLGTKYLVYFVINFSTLLKNYDKTIDFIIEIINDTIFNYDDIYKCLKENKANMAYNIPYISNNLANLKALSYISPSHKISELINGLSYYEFISNLCLNFSNLKDEIIYNLKRIYNIIFNKKRFMVSLTCSKAEYKIANNYLDIFYKQLKENDYYNEFKFNYKENKIAYITSTTINYVAMAFKFKKELYDGHLLVLNRILNYDYLWQEIRVLGGAYGIQANINSGGYIYLASYRDPNIKLTLNKYYQIIDYINNLEIDEDTLKSYIIGTFSELDIPLHNKDKARIAVNYYLKGYKYNDIIKLRKEIINTNIDDLRKSINIYKNLLNNSICVIGENDKINEIKGEFLEINNLE